MQPAQLERFRRCLTAVFETVLAASLGARALSLAPVLVWLLGSRELVAAE